jgi:hypothetical protein
MIIFLYLITLVSAKTIVCTHEQICADLNQLVKSQANQTPEIKLSQDHSVQLASEILVVPPHDLKTENWDMIKEREKLNRRTLHLYLSSKQTKFYKQQGSTPIQIISNYWLYPNLDCEIQNQLKGLLNELNYQFTHEDCQLIQNQIMANYTRLKKAGVVKININQPLLKMLFNQDLFTVELTKSKNEQGLVELNFSNNTKKTITYDPQKSRGKDILQLVLKDIP